MKHKNKYELIEVKDLEKGSLIPWSLIEEVVGAIVGTKDYRARLLQLENWIELQSHLLGKPLELRQSDDSLIILTDAEIIDYSVFTTMCGVRKIYKGNRLVSLIDRKNLGIDDTYRLTRAIEICSGVKGAITEYIKRIEPEPRKERHSTAIVSYSRQVSC